MKYLAYLILLGFFGIISCDSTQDIDKVTNIEKYQLTFNSFNWDTKPYKFKSYIKDSILIEKGSQVAAVEFSYIQDIENTLLTWDADSEIVEDTLSNEQIKKFGTYNPVSAIPLILKKAEEHEVIIVNEAHHMSQHRVFATKLLKGLYNRGYRHLGIETFWASNYSDSILSVNGYPTLKNGFYSKEPQYGNFIREAVSIGFQIFGYESSGHTNGKEREINQAINIKNYIENHGGEKTFIYCGFAHGFEGNIGGTWKKAMAGRLTEFTGINPLTINQTNYSEKSKSPYEDLFFRITEVKESTIFVDKNNDSFGKYRNKGWFDISVFHPRTTGFIRPEWMLFDDRKEVNLDLSNAQIHYPCLVFAYLENEGIGSAVPYDIQQIDSSIVKLILKPGHYNIVVLQQNEKAWKFEYLVKLK